MSIENDDKKLADTNEAGTVEPQTPEVGDEVSDSDMDQVSGGAGRAAM